MPHRTEYLKDLVTRTKYLEIRYYVTPGKFTVLPMICYMKHEVAR